jgi:hypothetical protein
MIDTSHIIKSQIFEIGFYDEDAGLSFQKSIAELIRDDLTTITEKCFNAVPEDQIVIINELVLELGDIPIGKVNQELPKKYEEELVRNLRLELQKNGKKQEVVDPQKNRVYLVRHFLMKGYMPWNYNSSRWTDFNELFSEMLDHSKDEFVNSFGELMESASARTRFIRQVDDEVIAKTITYVEPSHAETINKYHHDWMDQHKKEPFASASSQDLSKSLWEFIFNYLYEERGSYFNLKAFLISTIHQFAAHYNLTFDQVLSSLYRNYQKFQTSGLQLRLANVLGDIFNEFDAHQSSLDFLSTERERHEIKNITHDDLIKLLEKGKSGLPALDGQSIDTALTHLMNLQPVVVINFLIQLVKDQSRLAKLMEHLTESTKKKLVYVLEPTNAADVIHYHEKIIHAEARSEKIKHSESNFSNMVWQLIVVVLINQRGSAFNHKTFLKALIEKFAVRIKISYGQFLNLLMESLEKLPLAQRGTTPLTLIKSLLNEARKANGVEKGSDNQSLEDVEILQSIKSGKLTRTIRELGYHHFTDLIQYLLEADPHRAKQVICAVPSFSGHSRYLVGELDDKVLLMLGHLLGQGEMLELLKQLCNDSSKIIQMDLLRGKLIASALKDLSFSLILKSNQANAGIDSSSLERAIIAISKSYAVDFNLLLKSLSIIFISSSSMRLFSQALDDLVVKYHINVDHDSLKSQTEKPEQGNEETLIQIALRGINGIADRALIYNLGYKSVDDVVIYLLNHHAQRFKNRLTVLTQSQHSFLGIGRDISLSTFYALLEVVIESCSSLV